MGRCAVLVFQKVVQEADGCGVCINDSTSTVILSCRTGYLLVHVYACLVCKSTDVGLVLTGYDPSLNCFQRTTSLSAGWSTGSTAVAAAASSHNAQC